MGLGTLLKEYVNRLSQANPLIKYSIESASDQESLLNSSSSHGGLTQLALSSSAIISPSGSENIATAADSSKLEPLLASLIASVPSGSDLGPAAAATAAGSQPAVASPAAALPKQPGTAALPRIDRRKESRDKTVTLRDLFLAGLLKPGMVIEYRYKAHESNKTAVVTDQGSLRTDDGRVFPSLYAWVHKSYGSTGTRIGYFKLANSKTTFLNLRDEYLKRVAAEDEADSGPASPPSPPPSSHGPTAAALAKRRGTAAAPAPQRKKRRSGSQANWNDMSDDDYQADSPRGSDVRAAEDVAAEEVHTGEPSRQEMLAADVLGQILSSRGGQSLFSSLAAVADA
jgi:hypothetical protein